MTTKVQSMAEQAYRCFELATRKPSGEKYYRVKIGSPEWVTDLCRAAHGADLLPDDWRYEFLVEALGALSDDDDLDSARDSIEADVYTSDLTAWLGSRNDRHMYVDEAVAEYGHVQSIIEAIGHGQLAEKQEVFYAVVKFLEDRADASEGD